MSARYLCLAALGCLCLTPLAHAQHYYYAHPYNSDAYPWHGYVLGGFSQPTGNSNNVLQGGWDVGGGVAFRPSGSPLALRLELNYSSNNATNETLNQSAQTTGLVVTGGWADLWSLTANAELRFPFGRGVYGYLIGGIGAYYAQLNIEGFANGYTCYPWWYSCYYGNGWVTAYNDVTKFGWNAGAGVSWPLRNGMLLFVEARYNAIQTSQTLAYVPVTIGVRF
jgi:opacity protein-like surface antigen